MAAAAAPSIHASCVLVGARAVLIRGPSGSGKSRLALALLRAACVGQLPFARLVSDDRSIVEAVHGRVLVRAPSPLAGLLEIRGIGVERMAHEPVAAVDLVIDLAAPAERMPEPATQTATVAGIALPRLAVAAGVEPLPLVLAHIAGRGTGVPPEQPHALDEK